MRPNRSVERPPTNPVGAPSRDSPTATLRHDPPTAGRTASRPSAATTGTKSISASPQLRIMPSSFLGSFALKPAHRLAAVAIEAAQQRIDLALAAMELGHARCGLFGQTTERRHRRHGL